ncbi:toxin [Clostridium baratii]|uniref:Toxin complex component ORF-X1 n=2 Tax=Clostridium baratii TaxID=1561 RepID=A0A059PYE4_9CLOT|nr:hypothetical protein [Clostridium baratii]AGR53837.1 toxin complex component ORF-X1 [Clostridium baratii]AIY83090.1 putative oRF-X1 [Clostridium baratii str. Sullivan]AQM58528.1 toxin [Clostridium baratii]KJU72375.1 toxin [Clostridium baratii]OPF52041.1 toxin [Clostridium baratii]
MNETFSFNFNKNFLSSSGLIRIEKIQQYCSPNYQYFKITFIKGYIYIRNTSESILEKFNLKDVISLIALKKSYLNLPKNKQLKEFNNVKDMKLENRFNLYVINEDINNKLTQNGIFEESLLNKLLMSILLENEENLLHVS